MWLCSAERSHPAIYCHRYGLTSIGLEQVLDILSSRCRRGPPVNRQTMMFTVGVPWYAPPVMLNRICSPDKAQAVHSSGMLRHVRVSESPCRPHRSHVASPHVDVRRMSMRMRGFSDRSMSHAGRGPSPHFTEIGDTVKVPARGCAHTSIREVGSCVPLRAGISPFCLLKFPNRNSGGPANCKGPIGRVAWSVTNLSLDIPIQNTENSK
jgi:hypothetical protein